MNQPKAYVALRFRVKDEPNYVQLRFEPKIELSESYLQRNVEKRHNKTYPHRMERFVKYMSGRWDNEDSCSIDTIQVYMNNKPESQDNYYLASMYFTTGLKLVATGQKHCIRNFTVGVPIYVAKCLSNFSKYKAMVNTSKVLVNEAWIRDEFEIFNIKHDWTLDEHSIYFLYTVAHSLFSVLSVSVTSESVPVFDASTEQQLHTPISNNPYISSASNTRCTLPAARKSTKSPNTSSAIFPNASPPLSYGWLSANSASTSFTNCPATSGPATASASAIVGHSHTDQIRALNMKIDALEERLQVYEDKNQKLKTELRYYKAELESTRRENENLVVRTQEAELNMADALKTLESYL